MEFWGGTAAEMCQTFCMKRVAGVLFALTATALPLAGCGSPTPERDQTPKPRVVPAQTTATEPAASPTPTYKPHFDEREGDTYFYAAAASEEEAKQGKTLGSVVSFRYLGEQDGKHTLASVDDKGRTLSSYQCSTPCRIIKRTWRDEIERMPYSPRSVIGGAFEDALNGSLQVADKSGSSSDQKAPPTNTIPAAFVGEWNSDLAACGTGNNDSRLRIEPKRIRFYESDGDVRQVTPLNDRTMKVSASFAGEGQVWTDSVEFVLSRSGNDLSSGDVTRHRCPR